MITGIGIDMVEIERIAHSINKESGFRELVFSKNEMVYCEGKANKFQHYAARFAAKEAFFKALGSGWANGTSFNEIEIFNEENGKPGLRISGETAETLVHLTNANIQVSLSHTAGMATAIVIIENV